MTISTIKFADENYPKLLREISSPPQELYLRGTLPSLDSSIIAVVGTRKATTSGLSVAETIAFELAKTGLVVASGLAMGIDAAAHRGALKAGGKTVAVLGNGIDNIYPAQNQRLAKDILATGGAILSEYSPGTPSLPKNFIERNRIVSGLSIGVVIVEAPVKSGALITAGFAGEQGRSVFVVPGPISHPNYVGSHALIRDGATLITKTVHVLEDLGLESLSLSGNEESLESRRLSANETLIVQVVKDAGQLLSIDRIAELTNLPPHTINEAIVMLLLKGIIKENNGKYTL